MLRPNEISSKTFKEIGEGVYSAKEVDAFMNEVSASYEQVFRQNGELVRRLSLLANRLEAYRRQEEKDKENASKTDSEKDNEIIKDKLEQAKAVAQKMLDEAKLRAAEIIDNANKQADGILIDLNRKVQQQKITLDMLTEQSDSFKKKLLDTYREHLVAIDAIPDEAEKVAEAKTADFKPESVSDKVEEVLDEDDSDVLGIADNFIEKLDEPDDIAEVEAPIEEAEAVAEEAESVKEEPVYQVIDETPSEKETVEEQIETVSEPIETVEESAPAVEETVEEEVEEAVEEAVEEITEEADEGAIPEEVKEPTGFDFAFDGISFDDEDDEELDDDDDDDEEESKPFVVTIEEESENEVEASSDSDSLFDEDEFNNPEESFSEPEDVDSVFDDEEETEQSNGKKHMSLKEMIMARHKAENVENEEAEDADNDESEDDNFSEEKFVSLFSDDEQE